MFFLYFYLFFVTFLIFLFFFFSYKMFFHEYSSISTFECGFNSYYFSRFSFSIHYFLVALIFLFFDLELCFLLPLFLNFFDYLMIKIFCFLFISFLFLFLVEEWLKFKLDWIF